LTGLTSALWTNEERLQANATIKDVEELQSAPDADAGLYIMDRTGVMHKIMIPRCALAFQTGEALQVVTENKLKAVPHLVRGPKKELNQGKFSRNTLAVFTQPNLDEKIDGGKTFAEFAKEIVERNTVQ